MKLIDLLVKKHNEEGWNWPENADMAEAFPHEKGWVNFWLKNESTSGGFSVRDWCPPQVDTVKHEQYEAALTASKEKLIDKPQQPAWSGEGLPPVGCECEFFDCEKWFKVTMMYGGSHLIVLFDHDNQIERSFSTSHIDRKFRPIRTEAERKRDAAITAMKQLNIGDYDDPRIIYDAIAAGKIPGVKLEAPDA